MYIVNRTTVNTQILLKIFYGLVIYSCTLHKYFHNFKRSPSIVQRSEAEKFIEITWLIELQPHLFLLAFL
jgi:hypothetical protein